MADNEIHNTQSAPPKPGDSMGENFKKFVPSMVFGVVVILGTFFWNANSGQSQLAFQTEANRKAIEANAENIKANAETMNQFLIAITKLSEAQNRLAEDVKAIQAQQQRNTEMMMNRR